MENLGPKFKEIRMSKGLSRKDVCGTQLSPQFLGKFERGESDISLANFCYLLERTNVTYDEFFKQVKTTTKEIMVTFERKFEKTIEMNHPLGLRQLKEEYVGYFAETKRVIYQHFGEVCAYYLQRQMGQVEQNMLPTVRSYLAKVESWSQYEYYLAYLVVGALTQEEMLGMSDIAYKRGVKQGDVKPYANKLLITIILYLLEQDELDQAERLLNTRQRDFPLADQELFENFYWQYLRGLILIRKNDPSGVSLVEKSLLVWQSIEGYELYANAVSHVFDKNFRKSNLIFDNGAI